MVRRMMVSVLMLVFIFTTSSTLAMPQNGRAPRTAKKSGWTIYVNGAVYTVDRKSDLDWSKNPDQAVGIFDGIIECLGSNEEVLACAEESGFEKSKSKIHDLQNKYIILPGFHDVHQHPLEAGNSVGGTCELPGDAMPDSQAMADAINQCTEKTQKGTKWFLGHGHSIVPMLKYLEDETKPDPKTYLDGKFFDEDGNEMPVVFLETTSHSVWVNSLALKEAGFTKDSSDPIGGIILRNTNGEPNGILLENAGNMILDMAFDVNKYPALEQLAVDALRWSLENEISPNGITSLVDARSFWQRKDDQAWEKLEKSGELPVRAILALWAYPELEDEYQIEELKSRYTNDKSSLLRKSMIKFYSDGLTEAYTAALLEPYENDIYNGLIPENRGIHYFSEERLAKYLSELQDVDETGSGFDFLIHTIGDEAARQGLNAIRDTMKSGLETRHRLTHVELVDKADIPRFKELNVIADPQVAGDWSLFDSPEHEDLKEIIGEARASRAIPVKELHDSGAVVTLSSDWDVSEVNPFIGIVHATQRGGQAVDLKTAVEMYTINGAFAMRQEDTTGSVTIGKEADLIVIDRDIFKIPIAEVKEAAVLQTLLQGEEVWRNEKFLQ